MHTRLLQHTLHTHGACKKIRSKLTSYASSPQKSTHTWGWKNNNKNNNDNDNGWELKLGCSYVRYQTIGYCEWSRAATARSRRVGYRNGAQLNREIYPA